jgi:hypothetical protein
LGLCWGASGRQSAHVRSQRFIDAFEAAEACGEGYAEAVRQAAEAVGVHERTAQTAIARHRRLIEQGRIMQAIFSGALTSYSSKE